MLEKCGLAAFDVAGSESFGEDLGFKGGIRGNNGPKRGETGSYGKSLSSLIPPQSILIPA